MESSDETLNLTPESNANVRARSAESKVTIGNAYGEQSLNNEPLDIAALYVGQRPLLMHVASRKFRVPEADAEGLIQEVFLSFIQTKTKIENVRSWLVAAMCNACRSYWRRSGVGDTLSDDSTHEPAPSIEGSDAFTSTMKMQVTMLTALSYLQPRCREALQLHYYDGRSAVDVARIMGTTDRYAEKLIHNCLRRVREIYMSIRSIGQDDKETTFVGSPEERIGSDYSL